MTATQIAVPTQDGTMDVHLYAPDEFGPAPAVIFFADAGGVRPVMGEMAAQLATAGYLVAMPNLYYRAGAYEPFDITTLFSIPSERERMRHIIGLAGPDGLAQDTGTLLDALAGHPGRAGEQVGCVGYCMGGNWAFRIAARLYFGVADHDGSCDPESQAELVTALSRAGVGYQLELYLGAQHGFAVPDNPSYDETAAQRHWARLTTLFAETLGQPGD
jgi:carboxymethylenebutenolidase